MAKKITSTNRKDQTDVYPWLRLLEMEVQPIEHAQPRRGRGRPPNVFRRKPVHITLTDDELEALDSIANLLSERFGTRLHRGHVIAFMVFYLRSQLLQGNDIALPAEVNTLSDLARYVDKLKG